MGARSSSAWSGDTRPGVAQLLEKYDGDLTSLLPRRENLIKALAEDMQANGWLPGSRVVKDAATGVTLDGFHREAAAGQAGIEPMVEWAEPRDAAEMLRIVAQGGSRRDLTAAERKRLVKDLTDNGLDAHQIGEAIGVTASAVHRLRKRLAEEAGEQAKDERKAASDADVLKALLATFTKDGNPNNTAAAKALGGSPSAAQIGRIRKGWYDSAKLVALLRQCPGVSAEQVYALTEHDLKSAKAIVAKAYGTEERKQTPKAPPKKVSEPLNKPSVPSEKQKRAFIDAIPASVWKAHLDYAVAEAKHADAIEKADAALQRASEKALKTFATMPAVEGMQLQEVGPRRILAELPNRMPVLVAERDEEAEGGWRVV